MPAALAALAFLAASVTTAQVTRDAPAYTAATIVNAASNDPNALAPYTIIKIMGTNLAWDAASMQPSDIRNSSIPTVLPNTGVRVYISNQRAGILSVSPTQITAVIPADMLPGPALLWTTLDGIGGPAVAVNLNPFGPGMFAKDEGNLIVARENGDLVTSDVPLSAGDKFVVHAVGLGASDPPLGALEIPPDAIGLDGGTTILAYLNDNPIDPALISKVGLVAGQAALYQMTIQLPLDSPPNPELRIEANGYKSPAGFKIPVRRSPDPSGLRPNLFNPNLFNNVVVTLVPGLAIALAGLRGGVGAGY